VGYFSNGTEGLMYEERYCSRCIHYGDAEGPGCPVMNLHWLHNYDEANNDASMLHVLIPRTEEGENQQCAMFVEQPEAQ
jgi:hypothetical protein